MNEPGCEMNVPPCAAFRPENYREHRWVEKMDAHEFAGWDRVEECVDCKMSRLTQVRYFRRKNRKRVVYYKPVAFFLDGKKVDF